MTMIGNGSLNEYKENIKKTKALEALMNGVFFL
jgi:hypothetical protein